MAASAPDEADESTRVGRRANPEEADEQLVEWLRGLRLSQEAIQRVGGQK